MLISLPFIYDYSGKVQLSVILLFTLISYLNARARLVIGSLVGAYLAFKILVPVVGWATYTVKNIAWIGFYVYFFQKAVHYAFSSYEYILGEGLESLIRELDKHSRSK